MESDPAYADAVRDGGRRSNAKLRASPAYRERRRAWHAQHYAEWRDEIQARRRARIEAMTDAEFAALTVRMRVYGREYMRRFRQSLRESPELHRQYLDRMAAWRGARRLRDLIKIGDR